MPLLRRRPRSHAWRSVPHRSSAEESLANRADPLHERSVTAALFDRPLEIGQTLCDGGPGAGALLRVLCVRERGPRTYHDGSQFIRAVHFRRRCGSGRPRPGRLRLTSMARRAAAGHQAASRRPLDTTCVPLERWHGARRTCPSPRPKARKTSFPSTRRRRMEARTFTPPSGLWRSHGSRFRRGPTSVHMPWTCRARATPMDAWAAWGMAVTCDLTRRVGFHQPRRGQGLSGRPCEHGEPIEAVGVAGLRPWPGPSACFEAAASSEAAARRAARAIAGRARPIDPSCPPQDDERRRARQHRRWSAERSCGEARQLVHLADARAARSSAPPVPRDRHSPRVPRHAEHECTARARGCM